MNVLILGGDLRYLEIIDGLSCKYNVDVVGYKNKELNKKIKNIDINNVKINKYDIIVFPVNGVMENNMIKCDFNDNNIKCTSLIEKFCSELRIKEKVRILKMHYDKALHFLLDNHVKFDIVFLDPPYKMECLNEIVNFILSNEMINKNGIVVCEVDTLYLDIHGLEKIKEKKYGNKYIVIYKNCL